MAAPAIPLSGAADALVRRLADLTGSKAIAALDGATLLGERATMAGFGIPGRTSAGGACRFYEAQGDWIALNLARPSDRDLLPAWLEAEIDPGSDASIEAAIAERDANALLVRGRAMGLPLAALHESPSPSGEGLGWGVSASQRRKPRRQAPPPTPFEVNLPPAGSGSAGGPAGLERLKGRGALNAPRILDLSALWAGPLASHLLLLAGAQVTKVESLARPDAMRGGQPDFYALLNHGKTEKRIPFDAAALLPLITQADIVIESSRPRALEQIGIDADSLIREHGLVWIGITAHGDRDSIGFGDDCGVAGGLSAALFAATGTIGFVGDAIADPLTGLTAALAAWQAWQAGRAGRYAIVMRDTVAAAVDATGDALDTELRAWSAAVGQPFPPLARC